MNLNEIKQNTNSVVVAVNIKDEKTKIRLMELGIVKGTQIKVIKKSALKKTLLVVFNSMCFTLKDNLAKEIEVKYAWNFNCR